MLGLEEDLGAWGEKKAGREVQAYVLGRDQREEGETRNHLKFSKTAVKREEFVQNYLLSDF